MAAFNRSEKPRHAPRASAACLVGAAPFCGCDALLASSVVCRHLMANHEARMRTRSGAGTLLGVSLRWWRPWC